MPDPTKAGPPKPSPQKVETGEKWYSGETPKEGGGDKNDWLSSLEELFVFDPNFESCW